MTEQYDSAVAKHYAAYRPPLHELLLAEVIEPGELFYVGVDIGCGTGYSAITLARYCEVVFGLDPSEAMLASAAKHPQVTYLCGTGDDLSVIPQRPINIISFIGSLFYSKSDSLRRELNNACGTGMLVIVGDFEVLLDEIMRDLSMEMLAVNCNYDHGANLLDWQEFTAEQYETRQIAIELTSTELSHVLLADSNRYSAFIAKFGVEPFVSLEEELTNIRTKHRLQVDLYLARYRYSPNS